MEYIIAVCVRKEVNAEPGGGQVTLPLCSVCLSVLICPAVLLLLTEGCIC